MSDGSIRCFRCQELFVYERYTGTCSLSFYVGEGVELEDVSAKFEDGILRVSLPKKEQNRLPKSNLIVIEKQKCGRLRGRKVPEPVYVPQHGRYARNKDYSWPTTSPLPVASNKINGFSYTISCLCERHIGEGGGATRMPAKLT